MIKIGIHGKLPKFKKKITRAVDMMTRDLFDELKSTTPVDTGYAKSRWKKSGSINNREIQNDADYIEYLDEGSSRQAPKGMTGPAIRKIKDRLRRGKYIR